MAVSHAVEARLDIKGNAEAVLVRLGSRLANLDKQVQASERNLRGLHLALTPVAFHLAAIAKNAPAFSAMRAGALGAATGARALERALGPVAASMRTVAGAGSTMAVMTRTLSGLAPTMTKTARATQLTALAVDRFTRRVPEVLQMARALDAVAAAARSAAAATQHMANLRSMGVRQFRPPPVVNVHGGANVQSLTVGGGGPGSGRGGGGGGRAGSRLSGQVLNPSPWVAVNAARGAAGGVGAMIGAAGAEQDAATLMQAQGAWGPAERAAVMAEARRIVADGVVPGVTVAQAVRGIQETSMALGRDAPMAAVFGATPEILRSAALNTAITGRPFEEAIRPFARFSAITGGFTDPQNRLDIPGGLHQQQVLQAATIAFATGTSAQRGGRAQGSGIDPGQWEGLARKGGVALRRMSPEGQAALATRIQEIGGESTGTEATAFTQWFVSQNAANGVNKRRLERAGQLGLTAAGPAGAAAANVEQEALIARMVREGRMTEQEGGMARDPGYRVAPGQFRFRGLAAVRPDIFVSEGMMPTLAGQGLTTEAQQIGAAEQVLPRETSRRFVTALMQTREVMADILAFTQALRGYREAMATGGPSPTGVVLGQSFGGGVANVGSAFNNFLAALGKNDNAVAMLNEMAKAFNDLGESLRDRNSVTTLAIEQVRLFVRDLRDAAAQLNADVALLRSGLDAIVGLFTGAAGRVAQQLGVAANPGGTSPEAQELRRHNWGARGGAAVAPRDNGGVTGGAAPGGNSTGGYMESPMESPGPTPAPNGMLPEAVHRQGWAVPPGAGGAAGVREAAVYLDRERVGRALLPVWDRMAERSTRGAAPRHDGRMAPPLADGLSAVV